ncbi:7764_t:CDS:10 [Ambispora gerdemannii]|uniref:7764_t:CDS:1 n=1 Tax=Ambispora gerdemannii TaxID=144530 RepID=A0A9N9CV20_9GLOM|nr:7764_t:CDS:10 [Ambispora gerdemannii]
MEFFDMDIQPTKSNNNSTVTNSLRSNPILHVECCLKTQSTAEYEEIQESVEKFLREFKSSVLCYSEITDFYDIPLLGEHLENMKVAEAGGSSDDSEAIYILDDVNLDIHVYQLEEDEAVDEFQEEENVLAANHWELPSRALEGLWDNLIFDNNVKTRLIEYVTTTMLFSDRDINPNIISWNRVVLLHGPPGTGKTSLCRAFAQKLAIRLVERYNHGGKLLEINSHSLFSKWFSESGKLVQKLFQQIHDIIDEEDCFVCVLIDEIESLTASRKSSLSGADPSDAVRKNVLILATSNITEAIDVAFIDRADIKQYIGLPSQKVIYTILSSCIQELIRVGIISTEETLLDWRAAELYHDATSNNHEVIPSMKLFEISKKCQGMSGRVLRKLPFLAHAHFLQSRKTTKLSDFLDALDKTATEESSSSFRT